MNYLSRTFFILISAFTLAACGTVNVGRDFDVHAFEMKIVRGTTTQTQVGDWLGQPTSTGIDVDTTGERFDEWTYYFASGKLPGMSDSKFKMLQIKFDKGGIVRSYKWSDSVR